MVLETHRTLALQCPACLGTEAHHFNIFQINHSPYPLQCECGFALGRVYRTGGRYIIEAVSLGGERVRLAYSAKEFLRARLVTLIDPTFGDIIGFLGRDADVEEAVAKSVYDPDFFTVDAEQEDFDNPDVMYAVLARLHDLAAENKIACRCDRPSIGLDIFSDRVEIICSYCGSAVVIEASAPHHRERVERLKEIVMDPSSYASLAEYLRPLL